MFLVVIPFPDTDASLRLCSRRLLKTLQFLLLSKWFQLCNNYTFIHKNFPHCCKGVIEIVCFEIVVSRNTVSTLFPHIQQICSMTDKHSLNKGIIIEKCWKYCGKKRNCSFEQFLFLPQCFRKSSSVEASEREGKGLLKE